MKIENLKRLPGVVFSAAAACLAIATVASLVSCPSSAVAADSGAVVATIGTHKITEAEVNEKIKSQMAALESKIYDMKRQAIDAIADDYLISQAAQKSGMSVDAYMKKEVIDKVGHVSEADAKKYYDAHKGPGTVPFDKIKDRLVVALQNQKMQEGRDTLVEQLRKSEPLKVLLKAPRVEVSSAGHPSLGPATAPVTIVEFGDFQCPFCKRAQPTIKEVLSKYPGKVRLVYMDFPLPMHNHALDAAKAARCANEQGKFWQYHDKLFQDQAKESPADLKAAAKQLGLNTTQFDSCFDKAKYQKEIEQDVAEGKKLGVDGTPSFYIDGRPLIGAVPLENFVQVIDDEITDRSRSSKQARARAN
jgi:protein-disulfide isomerase